MDSLQQYFWDIFAQNNHIGNDEMHSQDIDGFTIHHNGDYSGDVRIVIRKEMFHDDDGRPRVELLALPDDEFHEVTIPFDVLKALVLQYFRHKMIVGLESYTDVELESWLNPFSD